MKKYLLSMMMMGCAVGNVLAQQSVEPMVSASWHQTIPFNDECPDGAAAGCGAIAVAQILNYYKMPAHGYGRATYGNVDVDFDSRSIDWTNIRDSYAQGGYNEAEGRAVASLVYLVGAAMKMNYGAASSPYNYPSMMWGLQHHLHFSPTSRYINRHYYSTAEWIEMLDANLQSGHPVFYRGDHTQTGKGMVGHMYVIDGKDGQGLYHFNFGHASKQQDKYADLNIINQGNGIWPGAYSVSYHHRQAMVTDLYPVDGLTDSDYDHASLVLSSPIVLGGHPHAVTIEAQGTVQAKFQVRYVSFTGGSGQYSLGFYRQGQLVDVAKTIRNSSFTDGGYAINIDRQFTLPDHLADGDYEMSVVWRDNADSPWVRGWDNAPNRVPVTVRNDVYTFTLPNYHTLETHLYLGDEGISEVPGVTAYGKVLEFTACNPSDNNFEDSLKVVVLANGQRREYAMPTSIYGGQRITYRFLVDGNDINTNNGYTVETYYKEVNTGEWMPLADKRASVHAIERTVFNGLEIYTIEGKLVKRIAHQEIESTYSGVLSALPKGIYVVHDQNGSRKFVKKDK